MINHALDGPNMTREKDDICKVLKIFKYGLNRDAGQYVDD